MHVQPTFWLPAEGLADKARADRIPYDLWERQSYLQTTPGASISYEYIALHLRNVFDQHRVAKLAFDRWNLQHLTPWLLNAGFSEHYHKSAELRSLMRRRAERVVVLLNVLGAERHDAVEPMDGVSSLAKSEGAMAGGGRRRADANHDVNVFSDAVRCRSTVFRPTRHVDM